MRISFSSVRIASNVCRARFMHHACELARLTAGIAALTCLETAATCRICHVNLFLNLI